MTQMFTQSVDQRSTSSHKQSFLSRTVVPERIRQSNQYRQWRDIYITTCHTLSEQVSPMNITWAYRKMLSMAFTFLRIQIIAQPPLGHTLIFISLHVNLDGICWELWFPASLWFFIKQYYLPSKHHMKMPDLQSLSQGTQVLVGIIAHISASGRLVHHSDKYRLFRSLV